jgi:hypothetical protein
VSRSFSGLLLARDSHATLQIRLHGILLSFEFVSSAVLVSFEVRFLQHPMMRPAFRFVLVFISPSFPFGSSLQSSLRR